MKNKSFTLIELLVVIALIGLLASIILVSLKGTREKAKIARGLEFSQSVQHALGADAVGIWSFDDCPGGTANDASGYGNNGTIYGAFCTDDTPYKIVGSGQGKYALSFVDDYVDCGSNVNLNMGTSPFTLEAWIKTSASGILQDIMSRDDYYDVGAWEFWVNSSGNLELISNNNWTSPPWYPVNDGKWHHVVGMRDSGDDRVIYVDGQERGRNTDYFAGQNFNRTVTLKIGSHVTAQRFFNGLIDEVRIYNEALPQAEIQKHYAEGLKRYQNLVKK